MSRLHEATPSAGSTDEWVRRFELLAHPTRLRLLTHMHLHPGAPVAELAAAADITQTAASQALRVLRQQGWVEGRRDGRRVLYHLIDGDAHALLHLMGQDHGTGAVAAGRGQPGVTH